MQRLLRRNQGVSIARLAQHLGLSEGTVSRALNNYPDIAVKTRQRVIEAANDLGYRPSAHARRLARGVIETVGFVLPERAGYSDRFLAEILDGIGIELAAHDWDLLVAAVPDDHSDTEVTERLIRSGKVGGFILTRTRRRDPRVDLLRQAGVPFVVHGRTEDCSDYSWLDIDNEKACMDAVRHLVDLGHQHIAYIGGKPELNFAHLRRTGYLKAMAAAGLQVPPGYVVEDIIDSADADAAMAQMLALSAPPTAVVCITDVVALGAMRAITRAGFQPGREVSVIGYDGLPVGLTADPPLTTMAQSSESAGREVVRMLMAMIDGADTRLTQKLWEAKLIQRASTNPPFTS
ncbi:substrate-binding domain-containing protein [Bauldia sp.]|uniref:substrate-binding domain-containing protein n=1 Tax=Bauldia sp. TaxID=2575872 RepID=UPI003BAA8A40